MSKYLVNKFMHVVNMHEWAEKAYVEDPSAFVAEWEKGERLKFTPAEREALEQRDYGKLYAMGAHPFLLWSFTEAVWIQEKPREELVKDYKEKAKAAGYPDFST
jgi:hypothetical protein